MRDDNCGGVYGKDGNRFEHSIYFNCPIDSKLIKDNEISRNCIPTTEGYECHQIPNCFYVKPGKYFENILFLSYNYG